MNGDGPKTPAVERPDDDVNPVCGHRLGGKCLSCGCCEICDGCYCYED